MGIRTIRCMEFEHSDPMIRCVGFEHSVRAPALKQECDLKIRPRSMLWLLAVEVGLTEN